MQVHLNSITVLNRYKIRLSNLKLTRWKILNPSSVFGFFWTFFPSILGDICGANNMQFLCGLVLEKLHQWAEERLLN
jgi:hypothetical protein